MFSFRSVAEEHSLESAKPPVKRSRFKEQRERERERQGVGGEVSVAVLS